MQITKTDFFKRKLALSVMVSYVHLLSTHYHMVSEFSSYNLENNSLSEKDLEHYNKFSNTSPEFSEMYQNSIFQFSSTKVIF